MNLQRGIRFELLNGINEKKLLSSTFIIYAHSCRNGIYVGYSSDPVKRWHEHINEANNSCGSYFNDPLKVANRECGHENFQHYVLAAANYENGARRKEATAIQYYGANLNSRSEPIESYDTCDFKPIEGQIASVVFLDKRFKDSQSSVRSDKDRKTVTAIVYMEYGRKRLKSLECENFPAGLNIECSRESRSELEVGSRVKLKVAYAEKRRAKYLVAANSSQIYKE
jgi:hypothetical protein